jgi:N-acetylglucosaminyldiphosphoundecaprenol N-acetyl-beta-D-mannosaminyltransferase
MILPSVEIMGLRISAVTLDVAVRWAEETIRLNTASYVCHINVHTLEESWTDSELHAALSGAHLAGADGMPLVWLARHSGQPQTGRVYGPDFMAALLDRTSQWTDRPCRHFFYGSTPAVIESLTAIVKARYPHAVIAGHLAPPFRPLTGEEADEHCRIINDSGADIVWVGLGAPRQEIWIHRHRSLLKPALLVGVGAAFDFIAGTKRQAPLWMQRNGLEWLFRLATEPQRLAHRYGSTIPKFLWRLICDALRGRKGSP